MGCYQVLNHEVDSRECREFQKKRVPIRRTQQTHFGKVQ